MCPSLSWPEDMDMFWIKFLSFVSIFCSPNSSYFMIVHIFKDKHKVAGNMNSMNLLLLFSFTNIIQLIHYFSVNIGICQPEHRDVSLSRVD